MKRFLIGLTLAALWLAPWTEAAENLLLVPAQNANKAGVTPPLDEASLPMVDRIVAVVNNNVVTYSELNDRTNLIAKQLTRQGVTLPERHILMRQVLEKMVIDAVQMQYAKDAGIKVDDTQLDQSIVRLAEENKLPLAAFRAAVEKEGVTWNKFREEIREEIILAHLREREVENRINVSDSEIDAQIAEENERGGSAQDEFQLAHILISVPENASPERVTQRQRKIQEALDQLNKGMEFAEVAATFSEAPDALKGGDLGWRPAARLPSLFANAASKLKPGEYSGILRSPNGFHILKLVNRRGSEAPAPITQFHVRQILVKTNAEADPNEAINKISSLNARLLGGEDFGKLAT
ncbi:MAG: molecular chaperone SurA, partial [Ferrovum sp.]|nr:molecular chaperone SurA [Ferrovum sp.]